MSSCRAVPRRRSRRSSPSRSSALNDPAAASGGNVELVRRAVEGWPRGDFRAAIRLFTDDVEMSAYQPEGILVFRGRDDVIRFMNEFGSHWAGYRVDIAGFDAVDDETVLVSGRQIGTGLSSGLEISEPVFIAVRIRDGRIAGTYWHVERGQALAAAGL